MTTHSPSAPAAPARTADETVDPILQVRGLGFSYPSGQGRRLGPNILDDVSFDLTPGETLSIVGESGSGKSTLARAIVQQVRPQSGSVRYRGQELTRMRNAQLREARQGISIIFQDSFASLDPRWTVADVVAEPLRGRGRRRSDAVTRAEELLDFVGLDIDMCRRERPARLSGGQCQRASIARALAGDPTMLIADEPVSALDVSVQAQVLNLFIKIQDEFGLAMLFISHDLSVVAHISHRILALYRGRTCELGSTAEVMNGPRHPYTAGLLSTVHLSPWEAEFAHLRPGSEEAALDGPLEDGCRYRGFCPLAQADCAYIVPQLAEISASHTAACHHPLQVASAR